MMKGGIEIAKPSSEIKVEIMGETAESTSKRAKVSDTGGAVATKWGLVAFLEWAMMNAEKDQANVHMLRCIISNLDLVMS
jgi:hypothetical protein